MPVITYMEMNSTISTVQQIKYKEKRNLGTYIRTLNNDEMYRIDCCIMCSLSIDFQTAIELKTERDLYKKLYKELLEKVVKSMD